MNFTKIGRRTRSTDIGNVVSETSGTWFG